MQQVPVGGVQLDDVESRSRSPDCSLPETVDHIADAVPVERRWRGQLTEGHRRRSHGGPTAIGRCDVVLSGPRWRSRPLAASVTQLDASPGAPLLDETDYRLPCSDVLVGPQTGVKGGNPALGFHRGRLCHDQTRSTNGKLAQMNEVPGVGQSLGGGRVLAHR